MTNNNAKESIAKIKDELADLDEPLARVRDLAYAVRMLASSDEMRKEPGAALDAMAETIVDELNELIERRENIWHMAIDASEAAGGREAATSKK